MQIGARTTGGVVKVTVTSGGSGYNVPPTVTIVGGGGTGATAVAHMAGTRVESVVIGNQGTGYTSSPTVSISPASTGVTVSSFTASTDAGTVTLASALAATTWSRVQAGTQSLTVSSFSSATQFTVGTTSFPTGAAALYASGTGATASAFAYTGALRPISFFKGRYQDLYGVDGMGRGFRWNGDDASVEKIGLTKPAVGPSLSVGTASTDGYLSAVQMVNGGGGYSGVPTVTITGGTPDAPATGRAVVNNGRVTGVVVTNRGAGYKDTPTIAFSGGIGTGASFGVGVIGRVADVRITASGSGYTTTPSVTANSTSYVFSCTNHGLIAGSGFSFTSLTGGTGLTTGTTYYAVTVAAHTFVAATTAGTTAATNIFTGALSGVISIPEPRVEFSGTSGLTSALATVSIGTGGRISSVVVDSAGTGETGTAVTAAVVGGAGTGASLVVDMQYAVNAVSAVSSGSGYYVAPIVTIRAASNDPTGRGAAVTSFVNTTGSITGVSVVSGGQYSQPPTALVLDTSASAQATIAQSMKGKYQCAIRYLDDTPESQFGPIPSSISELVEADASTASSGLTWSFSHYGLDDRVTAMELWRTTSDQSVILFRVATIQRTEAAFSGTYEDTLPDPELQDSKREGYALMPVTLPNGQINARRFQVPPAHFAEACMFQDRAWYAVDVTGEKPNTLYFSEVDEPESVPEENELVVQENASEPDKLVALVPLGGQLLLAQQSHLYALQYVSQPVIDASVLLVAYRGIFNPRCWAVLGGVAIMADSAGIYAFDGQSEDYLSVPVDDYWRDGIIDLSKSDQFHMRADSATKVVRFFYCTSSDTAPTRALCYCVATKAWWAETYPHAVTATCPTLMGGKVQALRCLGNGHILREGGLTDLGTAIPYAMRTGNGALADEKGARTVGLIYKPTSSDSQLQLSLHYNNSSSPRPNAISSDRGDGFTTTAGSASAVLNMNKDRSALGAANGFAQAHYSGRVDDRSAGGDRHVAVAVAGTQSTDPVVLYAIQVKGVE